MLIPPLGTRATAPRRPRAAAKRTRARPVATAARRDIDIEVGAAQKVIDTGPYARVRHPMYAGALLLVAGIPPALGSLWGLLAFIPLAAVIVWRLLDEEAFLTEQLPGYAAYRRQTRYRLIPHVW